MPERRRLTIETSNARLDDELRREHDDVTPGVRRGRRDRYRRRHGARRDRRAPSSRSSRPRTWARAPASASAWSTASSSSPADTSRSTASSGRGTTVRLFLPRSRGTPAIELVQRTATHLRAGPRVGAGRRGRRPPARVAVELLQRLGYRAAGGGYRGRRALDLLVANPEVSLLCSLTWSCRAARTVCSSPARWSACRPSLPGAVHVRIHGETRSFNNGRLDEGSVPLEQTIPQSRARANDPSCP